MITNKLRTPALTLAIIVSAPATLLATLCMSRDAHALGPVDLEVGAKAGFGSNPTGYAPNPLGAEVGGRAGVSFFGLYGGISGQYNFGGTTQGTMPAGPQTIHSYQYGIDLGFGFKVPFVPLIIRPLLGLGNYVYTPSGTGYCPQGFMCSVTSSNYFYLEPGVTALFTFGKLFVGADVNLFILPSVDTIDSSGSPGKTADVGITAHGQIGVRF